MHARLRASLNSSEGYDCSGGLLVPEICLHRLKFSRVFYAAGMWRAAVLRFITALPPPLPEASWLVPGGGPFRTLPSV